MNVTSDTHPCVPWLAHPPVLLPCLWRGQIVELRQQAAALHSHALGWATGFCGGRKAATSQRKQFSKPRSTRAMYLLAFNPPAALVRGSVGLLQRALPGIFILQGVARHAPSRLIGCPA